MRKEGVGVGGIGGGGGARVLRGMSQGVGEEEGE
jgi:hypothetical protein